MARIRCHYIDCVFLEDNLCGATNVEIDPDEGCLTFTRIGEVPEDADWEEEELDEIWDEEEDELFFDEDEEPWLDEDEA
jgi:hypothetical protein